jgi:hypothetical protein
MDHAHLFGGCGPANIAVFALVGLTLDALGSVLLVVDNSAFERYCRTVDSSGIVTGLQLLACFGPAVSLLVRDMRQRPTLAELPAWQRRWFLTLDSLALAYVAWYVVALRGPWLVEHASARSRQDVWSGYLSATIGGVPVVAFCHAVGFALLFTACSAAALRAFANAGYLQAPRLFRRFSISVRLLCTIDFVLVFVALATYATGGLL